MFIYVYAENINMMEEICKHEFYAKSKNIAILKRFNKI